MTTQTTQGSASDADTNHADTIIVNAKLYTHPWPKSRDGALAIRAGRIQAVGDEIQICNLQSPSTTVIDAHGGLLLPGFQDSHVHPMTAGLVYESCCLLEAVGREETVETIQNYVRSHTSEAWIRGWGWLEEDFHPEGPTRESLDALIPDRPAYLTRSDGHAAWVNSTALRLAGITDSTPDPQGGRIGRDADGQATGYLHEKAMDIVQRVLPEYSPGDLAHGLLSGQNTLLSWGITAWQDASVREDELQAYRLAEESGRLIVHVTGALWWHSERDSTQINDLQDIRETYRSPHFAPDAIKIMQDGVIEGSHTAALLEPYLDPTTGRPRDWTGQSFLEVTALNEAVAKADAAGFQLHFHTIGDRAVREALDALESAYALNGVDKRRYAPVLSHIQLVAKADRSRFAKLGAIASMQPFWAARDSCQEEQTIPFIGEQRAREEYPFRALADAGALLAGGSDWMISTAYPLEEIHVAVNRTQPPDRAAKRGPSREALFPENALTLREGLDAYTIGTATANHRQHLTGLLKPGYRADVVILDKDPFAVESSHLADVRPAATYVAGQLAWHA